MIKAEKLRCLRRNGLRHPRKAKEAEEAEEAEMLKSLRQEVLRELRAKIFFASLRLWAKKIVGRAIGRISGFYLANPS